MLGRSFALSIAYRGRPFLQDRFFLHFIFILFFARISLSLTVDGYERERENARENTSHAAAVFAALYAGDVAAV